MCGDGRDVSLIEKPRLIIYPTMGIVEEQDIFTFTAVIFVCEDI